MKIDPCPKGVINLLSGNVEELYQQLSSSIDAYPVNCPVSCKCFEVLAESKITEKNMKQSDTEMTETHTKDLVEKYIHFFGKPQRSVESDLSPLLDSAVSFRGPMGTFESASAFIDDVRQDKLLIGEVRLHEILVDGTKASALYELVSRDSSIGTVKISEWFEVKDGRISSIVSTYDASDIKTAYLKI